MRIRLGRTVLVHADGRTDSHDKSNSRFLRTRLHPDYERIDITVSQVCLDICNICDVMALTSLVRRSDFRTREAEGNKTIFITFAMI